MSDEDPNERDDADEDARDEDRARGFHFEVGLRSLSGLLGDLLEVSASNSPPPNDPADWSTVDESAGGRRQRDTSDRGRSTRGRADEEYLVDTRIEGDEFVVHADIPGATKDELSVGIHPRTNDLVIGREGDVIERVEIPWASHEATNVWFNNGVLEVRLRAADS